MLCFSIHLGTKVVFSQVVYSRPLFQTRPGLDQPGPNITRAKLDMTRAALAFDGPRTGSDTMWPDMRGSKYTTCEYTTLVQR